MAQKPLPVRNRIASALPPDEALPPFLKPEDIEGKDILFTRVEFKPARDGEVITLFFNDDDTEQEMSVSTYSQYTIKQVKAYMEQGGTYPAMGKFIRRGKAWLLD